MSVLNAWQRLDRVVPGFPFGNASSGNTTINTDPNNTATATGTAGGTALTIGSAVLNNGDVFLVHQTQGSGAGQWEFQKVASGGGTTSIVCSVNLQYTYVSGAQVVKFFMYDQVTLGSWTIFGWNTSRGGIDVICGRTSISGTGTITAVGGSSTGVGGTNSSSGATGAGFKGGDAVQSTTAQQQGDGTGGAGTTSTSANGNGGGGGINGSGGGGGGNASAGVNEGGTGGSSVGSADLLNINLGGGGGGGGSNNTSATERSGGGAGGGILILISKSVDISAASLNLNGGDADSNNGGFWDGGAGAGGSMIVICSTATLGSNTAHAIGGTSHGTIGTKTGSDGRFAVHHYGTVTGTTNPGFNDTSEPTLVEPAGGVLLTF